VNEPRKPIPKKNTTSWVLIGDFNTFHTGKTYKKDGKIFEIKEDDEFVFSGIFNKKALNVCLVSGDHKNTYRNKGYMDLLDHIWISKRLIVRKTPVVFSACDASKVNSNVNSLENIDTYNRRISDHCPLTVELGGF